MSFFSLICIPFINLYIINKVHETSSMSDTMKILGLFKELIDPKSVREIIVSITKGGGVLMM